ncbi:MAG: ABC transporter permease [Oscillospiraceae bacterium]|nr:ABC transporter permease [Oscillospiraceae bacterium]
MIKKDLKETKGLNIIILLFMIMVSTLAATSALLLFVNTRGVQVSQERTNAAGGFAVYTPYEDELGKEPTAILQCFHAFDPEIKTTWQEFIPIDPANIDFEGKVVRDINTDTHTYMICSRPRETDLVYDGNDKPFSVENGHISVPRQFARATGIKTGDSLSVTSQMGNVYQFTVSVIHKDPTKEWQLRFIVSDDDYEVLAKDSPFRRDLIFAQHEMFSGIQNISSLYKIVDHIHYNYPKVYEHLSGMYGDAHVASNNYMISMLVSVFLLVAAVFMFIIIALTLDFSIRSAIKKEERELGIMKALGTDTFSFRWLFAAKYIASAAVGGVAGIFLGAAAGRYLMDNFFFNISYTLSAADFIPSLAAIVLTFALMLLFIVTSLRRISRISVIDAVTGENRSEKIGHGLHFHLNRQKRTDVPFFLALSDIFTTFRRYILLMLAFTAGSIVVMLGIELRDTMISTDFLHKYYTFGDLDFNITITDKFAKEMSNNTFNSDIMEKNINAALVKEGIPGTVDLGQACNCALITDGSTLMLNMNLGIDVSRIHIMDGGQLPVLENEILIDKNTANMYGYRIGDTVKIEYDKYSQDRLSSEKTADEFIITGYTDRLSAFNSSEVIMSEAFDDAVTEWYSFIGGRIDAPESEKPAYLKRIMSLFPENVTEAIHTGSDFLYMYDLLLSFVRNSMIVIVTGVLAFLTVMYQTIFLKDEEHETALLKSCGFDDLAVKRWQFLRMMVLFGASQTVAAVLMPTVITKATGAIIRAFTGLQSWTFTGGWGHSLLWLIFITAVIAAVDMIVLKGVEKTDVRRIRNE